MDLPFLKISSLPKTPSLTVAHFLVLCQQSFLKEVSTSLVLLSTHCSGHHRRTPTPTIPLRLSSELLQAPLEPNIKVVFQCWATWPSDTLATGTPPPSLLEDCLRLSHLPPLRAGPPQGLDPTLSHPQTSQPGLLSWTPDLYFQPKQGSLAFLPSQDTWAFHSSPSLVIFLKQNHKCNMVDLIWILIHTNQP